MKAWGLAVWVMAGLAVAAPALADGAPGATAANVSASTNMAAPPEAAPARPPVLTRELIDLIQGHKLIELRTIYNGPFAAALFFDPENLRYYVALLKHHDFWWINKTDSAKEAEDVYTKMATQTIQLAAPTLAKIQLDARIAVARKRLQEAQERQAQLLEQMNTQNRIIQQGTAAQAQLTQDAQHLAAEKERLQKELSSVNSAIQDIQTEAAKGPEISLQPSAPAVPPASTGPAPKAPRPTTGKPGRAGAKADVDHQGLRLSNAPADVLKKVQENLSK